MRRELSRELKVLYAAAALLALGAAFMTFVLSERTADYWSWAIAPPISAAFLGAGYCGAVVLLAGAARATEWAEGRFPVAPVMAISLLLLAATLIHWDRFDRDHPVFWFWLVAYVLVPPVLAVLVWRQMRAPGQVLGSGVKLPGWARAGLGLHAAVLLGLGAVMFLAPSTARDIWPWALTPLTSRALGSFVFGFGAAAAVAFWQNDLGLLRIPALSYAVLALFQLIAVARYSGEIDFGAAGWVYVAFLASALLGGIAMLAISRHAGR
jgi:hypothetical protein